MKLRQSLISAIIFVSLLLIGSYALEWATPSLLYSFPENMAFDQPQQIDLVWEFSRKMNEASIENAIDISPKVDGEFTWIENTLTFSPNENWDMGEVVTIGYKNGMVSNLSIPVLSLSETQFEIRHTLLAYLFDNDGLVDIYALGIDGEYPRRLTENGDVLGFSVGSSGNKIFYAANNQVWGSDIYVYDRFSREETLIFSCADSLCENPVISPSGNHLAFTRTSNKGISELWIHSIATSLNSQISEKGHPVRNLLWTTRGKLSFYDAVSQEFILVGSDGKEEYRIENLTGEDGSWSPDGKIFVSPILFTEESDIILGPTGESAFDEVVLEDLSKISLLSSHLFAYSENDEPINLSKELWAEDLHPSISPDGQLMVFARRFNDEFRWIPGRQIAIMPSVGGKVNMLTNDEQYKYSNFVWHPNQEIIAAMRFNTLVFTELPEIWIYELSGKGTRLIIGGYSPQWIP
jgi:dipeptidyl aminopeptidase/acylaminoacyl peptidase